MSLSPPEYIRHMLDEIDYILGQVSNMDYESFVRDETLKGAFVRSIEVVGEASKKLLTSQMLSQKTRNLDRINRISRISNQRPEAADCISNRQRRVTTFWPGFRPGQNVFILISLLILSKNSFLYWVAGTARFGYEMEVLRLAQ